MAFHWRETSWTLDTKTQKAWELMHLTYGEDEHYSCHFQVITSYSSCTIIVKCHTCAIYNRPILPLRDLTVCVWLITASLSLPLSLSTLNLYSTAAVAYLNSLSSSVLLYLPLRSPLSLCLFVRHPSQSLCNLHLSAAHSLSLPNKPLNEEDTG